MVVQHYGTELGIMHTLSNTRPLSLLSLALGLTPMLKVWMAPEPLRVPFEVTTGWED